MTPIAQHILVAVNRHAETLRVRVETGEESQSDALSDLIDWVCRHMKGGAGAEALGGFEDTRLRMAVALTEIAAVPAPFDQAMKLLLEGSRT